MTRRRIGWFERLRRDGALFVLVAALSLISNLVQPLGEAQAADQSWTICTTHGVTSVAEHSGSEHGPGHSSECPCCIAGNHCGGLSAPKLLSTEEPAFMPLEAQRDPAPAIISATDPGGLPADPPPAIRAPPLSA